MPVNPADRSLTDDALIALFNDPVMIPHRDIPAFMYDEGMDQRSVEMIRQGLDLRVTTAQAQGLEHEKSDFRVVAHARKLWLYARSGR